MLASLAILALALHALAGEFSGHGGAGDQGGFPGDRFCSYRLGVFCWASL
ncbi:hypothetical protein CATMIT_01906, partial [Catenibacterium mitsuokai DSM 15897]